VAVTAAVADLAVIQAKVEMVGLQVVVTAAVADLAVTVDQAAPADTGNTICQLSISTKNSKTI
jgi:hypothetical protein